MKCPKCGYLGFETSERCRNCGYDFSLAVEVSPAAEVPLRSSDDGGGPLADFDLSRRDQRPTAHAAALDLDRMLGADDRPDTSDDAAEPDVGQHGDTAAVSGDDSASAVPVSRGRVVAPFNPEPVRPSAGANARRLRSAPTATSPDVSPMSRDEAGALPLFTASDDDAPLITTPRPVRPPLSVRRTTPEIPRSRARITTPRLEGEFSFPTEADGIAVEAGAADGARADAVVVPASATRRLAATLIDLLLLAAIDGVVVYLTLALARLTWDQIHLLPRVPIALFFVILDGGYLVGFIAASGQTIGKMLTGICVIADDGQRVTTSQAALRAAGCGLSLLTAGLGYLPAFLTSGGRALQDRLAGTRVVSAR